MGNWLGDQGHSAGYFSGDSRDLFALEGTTRKEEDTLYSESHQSLLRYWFGDILDLFSFEEKGIDSTSQVRLLREENLSSMNLDLNAHLKVPVSIEDTSVINEGNLGDDLLALKTTAGASQGQHFLCPAFPLAFQSKRDSTIEIFESAKCSYHSVTLLSSHHFQPQPSFVLYLDDCSES